MGSKRIVPLPNQWVTEIIFEQALRSGWGILLPSPNNVTFYFPPNCKIMVDAAVRLLSLANQLAAEGVQVTFLFEDRQHEALGYLNRANFFPLLSEQVEVLPARPDPSLVARYQGQSSNLVEFKELQQGLDKAYLSMKDVPTQLADALNTAVGGEKFGHTPYTLFGELVNNLYDHSQMELAGFAALQVYQLGQKVKVVVSDSGIGLLETLRPKLLSSDRQDLDDAELLRLLFNGDLAWENAGNGQGLQACASQALKHHASVSIRLSTCSVHLRPSPHQYERAQVLYQQHLIPLKGTHICFTFPLD